MPEIVRNLFQTLKVGDYIIGGFFLIVAVMGHVWIQSKMGQGEWVNIISDQILIERFRIKHARHVQVDGPLGKTMVIGDGQSLWIESSPCPHKYCLRMGKIKKSGEMLVCIPNRVVVHIEGTPSDSVDAVTQ